MPYVYVSVEGTRLFHFFFRVSFPSVSVYENDDEGGGARNVGGGEEAFV